MGGDVERRRRREEEEEEKGERSSQARPLTVRGFHQRLEEHRWVSLRLLPTLWSTEHFAPRAQTQTLGIPKVRLPRRWGRLSL